LQTIWPALASPHARGALGVRYRRERWNTPDGDFIDVDWLDTARPAAAQQPALLVLFHGLEGSSASPYARATAQVAEARGWCFAVVHFRGCSGELNLAPRAYHSGDFEEIGWILERFRRGQTAALVAMGVSLGGNALLRWAQEAGATARQTVQAVAAVSSPIDLTAGGHAIGRGLNRWIYTPWFLRTMKPKALAKLAQHPGLFDRERMLAARTLYAFDDAFTAPLHGFRGTDDYWLRASSRPHLARLQLPALVVNARNDPFVPAASLPALHEATPWVTLWQPRHGGHVGFAQGPFPGQVTGMPQAVTHWLAQQL
jgi:uncharacterized protein